MEGWRRRRIAFDNLAKEMLRYLDNSDDVKVGINELQERLEVPVQIGISIQQVAQLARMAKRFLKYFGNKKRSHVLPASARREAQWKGSVDVERRCQDIRRENTDAEQKTRHIPKCDRWMAQSARQSE